MSPKLLALRKATALIKSLDERTEDLEAGLRPEQEEHLEEVSECIANWRPLSRKEIKELRRGRRVQLRRPDEDKEVVVEAQLMAAGEPGTLYRLWEVFSPEVEPLGASFSCSMWSPGTTIYSKRTSR